MLIAFLTSDLVFPSRVSGLVQSLGGRMETAATAEALIAKMVEAADDSAVVLIDLASSAIAPADIVPKLKMLAMPPRAVIAFGPHVHQEKLNAAQAAGCDLVLTRGQFDAQFAGILSQFATQRQ